MVQQEEKKHFRVELFCVVTMLFWFSMYTYVPILAPYMEGLGTSHKLAGVVLGSYGFTQMILRIPFGIVSDRIGKRKIFIQIGLFLTLCSGLGLYFFQDIRLILLFRGLAGAAAATWVHFTILFSSYYKNEETTKAIGTINFFNSMGQMIAMFLGSWLAEMIGWQAPFMLGAAAGLLGMGASVFLVEKQSSVEKSISTTDLLSLALDRHLLIVSFLAILSQLLTFGTVYGFTPIYAESLGATRFQMGILTVFSTLPTAIASFVGGGKLSERFGEKRVIVFGFVLMGVFTLLIPAVQSFWILVITQVLAGFGRGFAFSVLMGLSIKYMIPEQRATAMGFFQAIYGIGMFIGPVMMGWISDGVGMNKGFVLLGIIGMITAVCSQALISLKEAT